MNFLSMLLFQAQTTSPDGVDIFGVDLKVWIGLIVAIITLITAIVKKVWKTDDTKETIEDKKEKDETREKDDLNETDDAKAKAAKKIFKKHLQVLREDIDADRVWIAKFHNGEPDEVYPGDDVWQMISVIEDAVAVGVTSEKLNLQNVPVLFYKPYLDKVKEHGFFFVKDIRNLSMPIYMLMKSQGIKSTGVVGLFNNAGYLKGVIGYDITKDTRDMNRSDIEKIENVGKILVEYLSDVDVSGGRYGHD